MHRLYFKIFLWFWLGVVIVSVTLVTLTALTHSRTEDDRRWSEKYGPRVDLWARQEVQILRRSGPEGLEKYVGSIEYDPGVLNYIFDAADRHEVLGRQPSSAVLRIVGSMGQESGQRVAADERIIAEKIADGRGREYVVVVDFPGPSILNSSLFEFVFENPDTSKIDKAAVLRIVTTLVVAGLFCFWLARQIVSPINRLRVATRAIANERLEARVDPAVLARRDELADLGHDFDRMAERIQMLVTAERRFLADVSHALRSPLARLNVALGLARQQAQPGASEHLDRIEYETERVNLLIGQLLVMARLDTGVDIERQTTFDLAALIDEIAADADYEARNKQCTVSFDKRDICFVKGARETLRTAIENVVRNAVQHTADRTNVEIRMSAKRVNRESRAVIEVRDHGWGVLGDAIERLFLPFHRIIDDRSKAPAGTGLGLAITKRTFELFGGSVKAMNAASGGLVVTLELPLREAEQYAADEHAVAV